MILDSINNTYFFVFFFLAFVIILSTVLFILSYLVVYQENYFEKISAYECGFEPFEDTRIKFDVRFYLVGILFIVFDIEVLFLFPWIVCFSREGLFGLFSMFIFLLVLLVGFLYEWQKGALDWS